MREREGDGRGPRSRREMGGVQEVEGKRCEAHWSRRKRVICVNIVAHLNSREVINLKNQL